MCSENLVPDDDTVNIESALRRLTPSQIRDHSAFAADEGNRNFLC